MTSRPRPRSAASQPAESAASQPAESAAEPLPVGFRILLDRGTRRLAENLWSGGSPTRVLRLTPAGQAAWKRLRRGTVDSRATGIVARRFTDAGLAHPVPPPALGASDVTVVIPVRDRTALLARCLSALGDRHPTIVVDDGSADHAAVAKVVADHGAILVRHPEPRGAAAARNSGLAQVTTELVALLDSDCVPRTGWIDRLAGHFADPTVAIVAPRVTPLTEPTWSGRYTSATCSLDLGDQPARVAPRTRVPFVPTAALVARRSALHAVARDGAVFDPAMPIGEDVDLVWRLHGQGWRVRYDPTVHIGHREPATWRGLLGRRLRYGTSAAPLAVRHPGNLAHLILVPPKSLVAAALTALGLGQYATRFAAPLLLAAMVPGGRLRTTRRAVAGALLLAPPLTAWIRRRPPLDPVRYTLAAIADDIAYGAGVYRGCLTHRTTAPLRPAVAPRTKREAS